MHSNTAVKQSNMPVSSLSTWRAPIVGHKYTALMDWFDEAACWWHAEPWHQMLPLLFSRSTPGRTNFKHKCLGCSTAHTPCSRVPEWWLIGATHVVFVSVWIKYSTFIWYSCMLCPYLSLLKLATWLRGCGEGPETVNTYMRQAKAVFTLQRGYSGGKSGSIRKQIPFPACDTQCRCATAA